jgi:hypothetical protein
MKTFTVFTLVPKLKMDPSSIVELLQETIFNEYESKNLGKGLIQVNFDKKKTNGTDSKLHED